MVAATLAPGGHGTAAAAEPPPPAPGTGYHKPTGTELTPLTAATAAVRVVRPNAMSGKINVRVAYGSFAMARSKLRPDGESGGPTTTGKASCFPGLECTTEDIERHERETRELDETSVYEVELEGEGEAFRVPASRVRRVSQGVAGPREVLIVDAHTGFPLMRVVNGEAVALEQLGPVTEVEATIPSESPVPASVTLKAPRSAR